MSTPNQLRGLSLFLFACLAALLVAVPARADLLELTNGDHYSGTVIALTRTNLEFQSEVQGLVKIPRDKVAKITLRESAPKPVASVTVTPQPATPAATSASPTKPASQTDAVIQQMRQQGVAPQMMNQIQEQILGKSSPEASRLFNEMVSGLMSGSLDMNNIRTQARNAIKDIQGAKKDLGDDAATGELLDGYAGILEKFMQETDQPDAEVPAPKPNPTKTPPARVPAPK
ncbi:MAG: hypothetical protein JWR69_204 [Pedosphaera sp.]|nr:hypothetical protein [Pedosphaera sp.]